MTKALKVLTIILAISVLAVVGRTYSALAHQIATSATVSFSANPATDGDTVTITGRVTQSGTEHTGVGVGNLVNDGKIQIQERLLGGVGVPVGTVGATWETIATEDPTDGEFSTPFDTTGLGGSTIGFRTHYVTPGGDIVLPPLTAPGKIWLSMRLPPAKLL